MQGPSSGWDASDPHGSDATTRHWQGQWESQGCGESSGWGASSWDQLGNGGHTHYEEFENVMGWDDSGALEALEISEKLNEERTKGLTYTVALPSPDLYIQSVNWNSHEDLKFPDPGGTTSPPHGERKVQRKRGRKPTGGFRRQFDRQETAHVADWKQSSKPFAEAAGCTEVKVLPEQEHANIGGPSRTQMRQGTSYPHERAWTPSEWQEPWQDHGRSNWSPHWRSSYLKQNSNWRDYGRSRLDGQQSLQPHPSQNTWRSTFVPSQGARGRGNEGVPYWSSHGDLNDAHVQGNDWIRQHETNVQSFTHQPFSTELRHQRPPIYSSDKIPKWRPQQSNRRWQ